MLLMGAGVLAVILANSPWAHTYERLLALPVELAVGDFSVDKPLHAWINDGLMGVFFFYVGLEIKRELIVGELSTWRSASLPAFAAVGGMLVPAGIYASINVGEGNAAAGWGVPMATDIAFALGVLALLGDRVPSGLRVFLTALAVVDDIGAVLVIALFYTEGVSWLSLGAAGACLVGALALNRLGVRSTIAYLLVGLSMWLAFLKSGVHATIAALLMAFVIPASTRIDGRLMARHLEYCLTRLHEIGVPTDRELNAPDVQHTLDSMSSTIGRAGAPLQKLAHALDPFVAFVVLPVFAFANAGVAFASIETQALFGSAALGIALGLFVGKPIGVVVFAWVAVKVGAASLPSGVNWRGVQGVGMLAGIGFTMSLFIAGLAFSSDLAQVAKVAIFVASLLSGVIGWWLVKRSLCPAQQ